MVPSKTDLQPRDKILRVALKLFADQGFERTTVRQIAKAAEVNISAISYYFGDKTGLYRATYTETMPCPMVDLDAFKKSEPTLEQALYTLFNGFIEPLKHGEMAKLCLRLHMREMVEPTGAWSDTVANDIAPRRQFLLQLLQKRLRLSQPDDDLQRLATSIVAMGVYLLCGRDVIEQFCPQIIGSEKGLDETHTALVRYAMNMVEAEAAHRKI